MRAYERIPSKYTVHLMDFSEFNQKALDHYNKDRDEDTKATDCKTMNRHGFIDTDDGMFVLCSEGVGDKNPVSGKSLPTRILARAQRGRCNSRRNRPMPIHAIRRR